MRSRAFRLTSGTVAWLAMAAGAFVLVQTEKQIRLQMSLLRAFEQQAREVEATLSDLRAAQQAYVAEGQGVAFWMPKVSALDTAATSAVAALWALPHGAPAQSSLDEAASTLSDFGNVDQRARDYLKAGQQLMASDVIYTEGSELAATAARQIESARIAEQQAFDLSEASLRKQQAVVAALATAIAAVAVLLLTPLPRDTADVTALSPATRPASHVVAPEPRAIAAPAVEPRRAPPRTSPVLKAAADLATDFGRVRDLDDLTRLLGRAAHVMDASGLVVWIGSAAGADLRPVLAHGYSTQAVARMPAVSRTGDNAAAAAYRTGSLQIVLSRPGGTNGAVVAPILAPDGCIGALSAEIRGGGESSESVHAMAAIFAAHLAGVLQAAPDDKHQSAAANS